MLAPDDLRVGLGCMRLSTDRDRDEPRALATLAAALDAGITLFDTARAYGHGDADLGHNERLLVRALGAHPAGGRARVVTKGGMTRPAGAWRPDGRASSIAADCEASLRALDGRPIDLYLLHAPDPRVSWATSVRALAALVARGLVARVGVCNVRRGQLVEALDLAPLVAVEVALGAGDDEALRGGVVGLALERGLTVLAHAPLGGPQAAPRLARNRQLQALAARAGLTPAELVLAWLCGLDPRIVPLPGARRPETARSAAHAARATLDADVRAALDARLGTPAPPRLARAHSDAEVVLIGGLSGAGKSTAVAAWVARGYERLNRDERGGNLARLVGQLDQRLAAGGRRLVLDNTYLSRASRADVLRAAHRHGVAVRCVWLDTPPAEAQRNIIARMLAAHGALLPPEALVGKDDPTRLAPRVHSSQLQALEPPDDDEGFAVIDRVAFVRAPPAESAAARAIALEVLVAAGPGVLVAGAPGPRLVFAWLPDGDAALAAATAGLDVERAACTHPAGPPVCWCRPPLPGLLLAFAQRHAVDPARLTVVGTTSAHRRLAAAAGATWEPA